MNHVLHIFDKANSTSFELYKRTIPEPLTPTSDQDRISPYIYQYNINQINDENKEK